MMVTGANDQVVMSFTGFKAKTDHMLHVIHIEDDPQVASLAAHILHQSSPDDFRVDHYASLGDAGLALDIGAGGVGDVILLDLNLPDSRGWSTFSRMHQHYPDIPIVVLTGDPDQAIAIRAVQEGAQDYLLKSELRVPGLLARILRYAVERHRYIKEIESARRQLLRQNKQLQEAMANLERTGAALIESEKIKSLGQMAAGIAHELKNPLAIIRMGLDYLDRSHPDRRGGAATKILPDLFKALSRGEGIIADMMDYSAPLTPRVESLSLNALIEEALDLIRPLCVRYHIEVRCELTSSLPPLALDRKKIIQLLMNLLSNAVQAMSDQGAGVLTVRTVMAPMPPSPQAPPESEWPDPMLVTAEISDTGPGIPVDVLPRVFDPFFTTKSANGGTGLGLPVGAMIMEQHGGRLELSNHPGGGAMARLTFVV
ncbi:MAG TPA: ATP-binding protein [Kiritimatiellia bacterium]|nr:ATP-binding protein [Kiritimatiellia bacterium]HMO99739.1 ATP-binding protein [Kiritimatiellia bacterium]HMP97532.1 ATP-binding protein [Kiritimatiellia bacterium]